MRRNKKKKKAKKSKADDANDINKYFDNTNFDTHLHFKPTIPVKMISVHPLRNDILAVYDKNELLVIWLEKQNMTEVQKYRLIDNGQEIKSAVFTKDSLIWILGANGYVSFYNYEIDEMFRGGFHPYEDGDDLNASPSNPVTKANLLTSSIFCPLTEIDHHTDEKLKDFKMKRNLITQGTLITSRYKNSEFTLWDLQPLLEK